MRGINFSAFYLTLSPHRLALFFIHGKVPRQNQEDSMFAFVRTGKPYEPGGEPSPKTPRNAAALFMAFIVALLIGHPHFFIVIIFLIIMGGIGFLSIRGLVHFVRGL